MTQPDLLWKAIIEDFFPSFLKYFFEEFVDQVDMKKGFNFMDKELQKIAVKSEDKRRFSDKLVKLFLNSGDPLGLLIHVEVQGYVEEKFAERMYINQYRIFDRFKLPTAAIAIFTDNSPNFHPKEFRLSIFNTTISYQFLTYKLRDKKLADFRNNTNPFSIIMETAWWGLKKNKLSDQQLFHKKIALYKRIRKLGFNQKQVQNLLDFIKFYTKFEQASLYDEFDNEINIISKNLEIMSIREAIIETFKREAREEGLEEGLEKGLEKGRDEGREEGYEEILEVIDRLKKGEKESDIAKVMNINIAIVKKIKKEISK